MGTESKPFDVSSSKLNHSDWAGASEELASGIAYNHNIETCDLCAGLGISHLDLSS